MTKYLIVVAGNIGVGKTSLTERIGSRLGWRTGYESVADNPYLADFYSDMRSWSFHLQIFFLGHRADQYIEAAQDAQGQDDQPHAQGDAEERQAGHRREHW